MIVTALVMGVALKDGQPLSDAEIRARAAELGMVDEDFRTLADVDASQNSGQDMPSASQPGENTDSTPEPTVEPASTAGPEGTEPSASEESSPSETEGELPSDKPLPMVTLKPSPDDDIPPGSTQEAPETVSFEIRSGQSSYGVSKSLVEAGLVEDALAFDKYLEDNGYSKRISTGTYEIPMGSTEEEIAKIITRSR